MPWKWRSRRKFSVVVHGRRQAVVGALRFHPPPAIGWDAVGCRIGGRLQLVGSIVRFCDIPGGKRKRPREAILSKGVPSWGSARIAARMGARAAGRSFILVSPVGETRPTVLSVIRNWEKDHGPSCLPRMSESNLDDGG